MKAILFEKYGSPDVLELKEVAKPAPGDDEVLVQVHAVSVNPLDWHRMRGAPFIVRFTDGLRKPKDPRIGADIAGRVEAVGSNATQFQPGDAVFGEIGAGGLAEYVCVSEKHLAPKPANLSFEQAAAVPVAGLTALQALRDHGQVQAGQHVLINGASGGVGTYAVQIAKVFGAEITAVCSTRNVEMVQLLGADHVIDYTKEKPTQSNHRYDLIVDNVGNFSAGEYKRALKPGGTAVVVGFTTLRRMLSVIILGRLFSGGKKIGSMLAQPKQEDLMFLKELLETGQIVSAIDKCYPLAETAAAIRYLENGHARGKVIVTIVKNSQ
jgi:NADPH:quinone reductase-like Zn-dependent oxidoreductase